MCSNTCSVRSYANLINPSKINVYQLPTPAAPVNIDKLRQHDIKNAKTPVNTRVLASFIVCKLSDNLINILIIALYRQKPVKSTFPDTSRHIIAPLRIWLYNAINPVKSILFSIYSSYTSYRIWFDICEIK